MDNRLIKDIKRRKRVKVMTKKRRQSRMAEQQQLRTARIAKTVANMERLITGD